MQRLEPLPFLADLMLLHIVRQMAQTQPGVLTIAPAKRPFFGLASITEIGREVVAGRIDYLSLKPPERWLGGVRVTASGGGTTHRAASSRGCDDPAPQGRRFEQ